MSDSSKMNSIHTYCIHGHRQISFLDVVFTSMETGDFTLRKGLKTTDPNILYLINYVKVRLIAFRDNPNTFLSGEENFGFPIRDVFWNDIPQYLLCVSFDGLEDYVKNKPKEVILKDNMNDADLRSFMRRSIQILEHDNLMTLAKLANRLM